MKKKQDCNHKKVFANTMIMTYPPQQEWICSKCGEKGIDRIGEINNEPSYSDLVLKFDEKGE